MRIALLLAACVAISCSSKIATKTSVNDSSRSVGASQGTSRGSSGETPAPSTPPFKFSFRISGSGLGPKPYDSFLMDTNHQMGVHTAKRGADGKFRPINALAALDPQDFDTLQQMIVKGKLFLIDSNDVTEVCPEDELYQVDIVPLAATKPVRLAFSTCATDYNLLLQPERTYFRKLIEWFERMRVKYRPVQPE